MQQTRNIFELGPTAAFDEGDIEKRSRFCCVRQHNNDNPDKFCIDLFVLANSTHYLVRHIDVYQVNNAGKVDIHARAINLPT